MQLKNTWKLMFLLMNMAFCLAQAQTKSNWGVKGVLLDSLTNEGEPYATIRIVLEKKTEPVKLAVTDLDGKFNVDLPQTGNFAIHITSIGKKTVSRNFSVTDRQPLVDLGKLYTSEASEELCL